MYRQITDTIGKIEFLLERIRSDHNRCDATTLSWLLEIEEAIHDLILQNSRWRPNPKELEDKLCDTDNFWNITNSIKSFSLVNSDIKNIPGDLKSVSILLITLAEKVLELKRIRIKRRQLMLFIITDNIDVYKLIKFALDRNINLKKVEPRTLGFFLDLDILTVTNCLAIIGSELEHDDLNGNEEFLKIYK